MSTPRPRPLPAVGRASLLWLLWLALLLPLAQSARLAHGIAHGAQEIAAEGGKQLPHELQCEQCLSAAALGAGAAAASPIVLPRSAAGHVQHPAEAGAVPPARRLAIYRSRAPPPPASA